MAHDEGMARQFLVDLGECLNSGWRIYLNTNKDKNRDYMNQRGISLGVMLQDVRDCLLALTMDTFLDGPVKLGINPNLFYEFDSYHQGTLVFIRVGINQSRREISCNSFHESTKHLFPGRPYR